MVIGWMQVALIEGIILLLTYSVIYSKHIRAAQKKRKEEEAGQNVELVREAARRSISRCSRGAPSLAIPNTCC